MCIDFRQANRRTIKDAYALPRIEELLDCLGGMTYFSVLDMKSEYHQVEIEESHKEKTAFTVGPLGFFEYNRMPFGLSNAPATYQRLMEQCLEGLHLKICLIYLDDLIIFSKTYEEHIHRLEMVFKRLQECGLRKSASFSNADIARPLSDLMPKTAKRSREQTSKTKGFKWGQDQQRAFDRIKTCLSMPPVLEYADYTKPFELHIDASTHGLGAVLYQHQDGHLRVIAYTSRGQKPSERNYSASLPNQKHDGQDEVFFNNFIIHYGIPKRIHSDQGANFTGKLMQELCQLLKINKSRTTPYHPMGNGMCERFNRTLCNMLGTLDPDSKKNWRAHVGPLVNAYNCTRHESTGFAPFSLMCGRHPCLPVDIAFGLDMGTAKQKSMASYTSELKDRLTQAYDIASIAARKSQSRNTNLYDQKARAAILEKDDRCPSQENASLHNQSQPFDRSRGKLQFRLWMPHQTKNLLLMCQCNQSLDQGDPFEIDNHPFG
ncbi:uncharacterized protein [Haliotis asinina]|uniref:uncharacterized protein n=1 Tax=Haliotis asinina TaxID=109174 RepID=UPI003531D7CC